MAAQPTGTHTTRTVSASLSHPVDAPGGIVEGQLLVAHYRYGQGAANWTDLAGWTVWVKNRQHTVAYKVATAADVALAGNAAAWMWTSDTSGIGLMNCFRVSGRPRAASRTTRTPLRKQAPASFTAIALQPTGADRLLLWFGQAGAVTWIADRGTELYDDTGGTNRSLVCYYETWPTATDTGTATLTLSASVTGSTISVAIAPATGATVETLRPDAILD
jgi:hypothetical protein